MTEAVNQVLADYSVSASQFKANPQAAIDGAEGGAVVVLNHNKPQFYCVPPEMYAEITELLEDVWLARLAKESENDELIETDIDELLARI